MCEKMKKVSTLRYEGILFWKCGTGEVFSLGERKNKLGHLNATCRVRKKFPGDSRCDSNFRKIDWSERIIWSVLLSRSVPRDYGTVDRRRRGERRRTIGGSRKGRSGWRKSAHINTYATQTKTHKGPRSWQIRSCGMQIRAY